ncbi:MAG: DUF2461 domain-containing protein [Candidatus Nanopelagicales bacterium]
MTFAGFAPQSLAFYEELEVNNTRAWWTEHKPTYDLQLRAPMQEMLNLVADEFGPARIFRPHRDVRFSKNKEPYKTNISAIVQIEDAVGYYVQLSASGLMIGGGWYAPLGLQLQRFRAAIDTPAVAILDSNLIRIKKSRPPFVVDGAPLKTRPRGVSADHPRLDLLRFTQLTVIRDHGVPSWLSTAKVATKLRQDWQSVAPVVEWLADHVGPGSDPTDD